MAMTTEAFPLLVVMLTLPSIAILLAVISDALRNGR